MLEVLQWYHLYQFNFRNGTIGKEIGANGKNGNTNGTNVTSQQWTHFYSNAAPMSLSVVGGECHLEPQKKVQVGNDQEMVQSERNSHSINRGVGKN